MEIHHEETETKGRYWINHGVGQPDAELTYSRLGTAAIIIDHTSVPDIYRGQGLGVLLVARVVEDARTRGLKITQLCPFAAAQLRRHADWHDVLA